MEKCVYLQILSKEKAEMNVIAYNNPSVGEVFKIKSWE